MAVARDADSGAVLSLTVSSAGGTTGTNVLTVGATASFLLIGIEVDTATPGTLSVSWAFDTTPVAMTQIGTTLTQAAGAAGAPASSALFGLINPTSGAHTARITASGQATGVSCYVYGISYTGSSTVSVAAATEGFNTATGTSATAAVSSGVSIPSGDMASVWWIDLGVNDFTSTFTPGNAQGDGGTAIGKNTVAQNAAAAEYYSGAGATIAASAGFGGSNVWGALIVGIKAPGGGGDTLGGAMQLVMMSRQKDQKKIWVPGRRIIKPRRALLRAA